jgi:hypothetical protein
MLRPLFCTLFPAEESSCAGDDEQVTIINKRREHMTFDVYKSFTLRNVIINSLDSIITVDDEDEQTKNCLNSGEICCNYNEDTHTISTNDINLAICDLSALRFKPKANCLISEGEDIFKFKFPSQTTGPLTSPNTLIIENCVFSHFLYNYHSIIGLHDYGANIQIIDSTFYDLNSCGAIISNIPQLYKHLIYEDDFKNPFSQVYPDSEDFSQKYFDINYALSLSSNPDISFADCNLEDIERGGEPCFSLEITNSNFEHMHKQTEKVEEISQVDDESLVSSDDDTYGFVYRASVLNLNKFRGHILISKCTFENNFINLNQYTVEEEGEPEEFEEEENGTVSLYGDASINQVQSLINIRNHYHRIAFLENTFTHNSGTDGIVYMHMLGLKLRNLNKQQRIS